MNNKIPLPGSVYILGYCVLSAAVDVLLSGLLQHIDLFTLLFWTFTLTWLGFTVISLFLSPVKIRRIGSAWKLILYLNISTLGAWVGLFIGLKWTEPSILVAMLFGLSPVISLVIERCNRNAISKKNIAISIFLVLIVMMLLFLSVKGQRSNPFSSNTIFALVLSLVCIVTSACIAAGTYISKSLSENNFKAVNIQSLRFPLLIFICFLFLPRDGGVELQLSRIWLFLPLLVVFGNILPLWMLQKGLELSNPLTTNIIVNVSPCITLLIEVFDPSLNYSNMKLLVLVMLLLTMIVANDDVFKYIITKLRNMCG